MARSVGISFCIFITLIMPGLDPGILFGAAGKDGSVKHGHDEVV